MTTIQKFMTGPKNEFRFDIVKIQRSIKFHGLQKTMQAFIEHNMVKPLYRYCSKKELENMLTNPAEIWLSRIQYHQQREQDSSYRSDRSEGNLRVINNISHYEYKNNNRKVRFTDSKFTFNDSMRENENFYILCHSRDRSQRLREENDTFYIIWPYPIFFALINNRLAQMQNKKENRQIMKFENVNEVSYGDAPDLSFPTFTRPKYHAIWYKNSCYKFQNEGRAVWSFGPEFTDDYFKMKINGLNPDSPYGCGLYPVRSSVNLVESVS